METRWKMTELADEPMVTEQLILEKLGGERAFTFEELLAEMPELNWVQLFAAIDALSRRGDIELRREGFLYTARAARPLFNGAEGLTWSDAS